MFTATLFAAATDGQNVIALDLEAMLNAARILGVTAGMTVGVSIVVSAIIMAAVFILLRSEIRMTRLESKANTEVLLTALALGRAPSAPKLVPADHHLEE